ncbi:acetate/propionate family kinase [Pontibaca methylaminivorans]|uniref:Acetate kinase n=1 Tax=Pontibaca methylaminivorans TaxID=515897 RepID=A0A1R3WDB3_9RHOB|nr:acetate/propionate family kinase [Pontibaca methylaminivorans]SIT75830.1 acetate kinase [Pontibaca methylaminivorans]
MTRDLIVTVNPGSSTIKMGLFRAEDVPLRIGSATIDFRGAPFALRAEFGGERHVHPLAAADRGDMVALLREALGQMARHVDLDRTAIIGNRVVHGGDLFAGPAPIGDEVFARIRDFERLAPLHQPQCVQLIEAIRRLRPEVMQSASFDTAFHMMQEPIERRYAIPRHLHDQGLKRYGFHGLSYAWIARRLAELGAGGARVVAAHLGSGASLCAMSGGLSRASSMGFSTLEGIPMATRPGSVDPGLLLHLLGPGGWSLGEVERMLYHESGLLGLSGISADSRELLASTRPEAAEAIEVFTRRIAGEVARLGSVLGGIDVLVFTAGIGENQPQIRAAVAERLAWLGVELDAAANAGNALRIGAEGARIDTLVIPTDEEQIIAEEALAILRGAGPGGPGRG